MCKFELRLDLLLIGIITFIIFFNYSSHEHARPADKPKHCIYVLEKRVLRENVKKCSLAYVKLTPLPVRTIVLEQHRPLL